MSSSAINQRGRHGPYHLPTNWTATEGNPGELLYAERICGRYWARFEEGEFWGYHDPMGGGFSHGVRIGKGPTITHALVVCRDHMHGFELCGRHARQQADVLSSTTSAEGAKGEA